jgi:DNA-binding response OmpR family regulator
MGFPVILITARRRELDEILGLEMGADDYITKPFNLDVLLARVKAVMRRHEPSKQVAFQSSSLAVGDLVLDPVSHTVTIGKRVVDMRPREFELLHAFVMRPKTVLTVEDLLANVWGAEFVGEPQVVYVHIRWLRKIIEEDPDHPQRIITIHGVGYKLEPQGE